MDLVYTFCGVEKGDWDATRARALARLAEPGRGVGVGVGVSRRDVRSDVMCACRAVVFAVTSSKRRENHSGLTQRLMAA